MNLIKKVIAFIKRLVKRVKTIHPYDPKLRIAKDKKGDYVIIQLKLPSDVFMRNSCFIHTSLKTISDLRHDSKTIGGGNNVTKGN